MKTTSPALLPFALSLAAFLVTGCGNDGTSPKITSFVASSQSLPEGGADVTFTWDVTREKTVELLPFPGLVTGSSATVNVTEPTTFTLVAKNKDGSDRKKLSIAIGEPFTVNGTLLLYGGFPAANAQVFVDDRIFVTDAEGRFTADDVIPPYEVGTIASNPGGSSALYINVFAGVTRPDPVLLCNFCNYPSPDFSGSLVGTVTGGAGFPYPAPMPDPGFETNVVVSAFDIGSRSTDASGATGDYNLDLEWNDVGSLPVSVASLQYQTVPEVLFTGYAREASSLTNGVPTDVDLTLGPVSTSHITGLLTAPFEVTNSYTGGWVDLGDPSLGPGPTPFGFPLPYAERLGVPSAVISTNASYRFAVPAIPGATYGLYIGLGGPEGNGSRILTAIPASTTTLDLEMPAISRQLTPVDNAVANAGTVFSTSPVPGAVYQFRFYSSGATTIQVSVFSDDSAITFPDLGMIGAPADGRVFDWSVALQDGFGSINGLLEDAQNPVGNETGYSSSGSARTVTYSGAAAAFGRSKSH